MLCSSGRPVLCCTFTNLSSLLFCVEIILPSRFPLGKTASTLPMSLRPLFSLFLGYKRVSLRFIILLCFFLEVLQKRYSHVLPKVLSKDVQRILHWRILHWQLQCQNPPIRQIKFPANLTTYTVLAKILSITKMQFLSFCKMMLLGFQMKILIF